MRVMPDNELERYDIHLLGKHDRNPWSMMFQANSFAHAEEQAIDALSEGDCQDEIVKITRDY